MNRKINRRKSLNETKDDEYTGIGAIIADIVEEERQEAYDDGFEDGSAAGYDKGYDDCLKENSIIRL